jgi:transposase
MRKPYSQDLRDRVIDAVDKENMSCRAAARLFKVSPSTAVKWMGLYRRTGRRSPSRVRGHRPSALMPHREFLEAARAEKADITLEALGQRLLAERGVKADTSMLSRFFRRIGVTLKKNPRRPRAGSPRHKPPSRPLARLSRPHRSRPPGVHRRNLDQDQHDAPAWLGAARRASCR